MFWFVSEVSSLSFESEVSESRSLLIARDLPLLAESEDMTIVTCNVKKCALLVNECLSNYHTGIFLL